MVRREILRHAVVAAGETLAPALDKGMRASGEVAQAALHTPGVGFSEFTDPAFVGLVEQDGSQTT
jgi:hypothetical protein